MGWYICLFAPPPATVDVDELGRMMWHRRRYRKIYRLLDRKQRQKFHLKLVKLGFHHLSKYVKLRDGMRCFSCGHDDPHQLHAHHLYPKHDFPEKFWEEDNLITLCVECHGKVHGYRV